MRAARYAVESGAFPLYEVEDGSRYTLNHSQRTRPVADYLALQRRYRHLDADTTNKLQTEVDQAWDRLARQISSNAAAPVN